jgi:hypothetical protein
MWDTHHLTTLQPIQPLTGIAFFYEHRETAYLEFYNQPINHNKVQELLNFKTGLTNNASKPLSRDFKFYIICLLYFMHLIESGYITYGQG